MAERVARSARSSAHGGRRDGGRGARAPAGDGTRVGRSGHGLPQPAAASGGKPLPPVLAETFGRRFNADFGAVRLHQGAAAEASAEDLQARAYTVGEHIVLGRGAPPIDSHDGKRVLAHELAHVVQQRRGGPPPALSSNAPHEAAADRAASAAMTGSGPVSVGGATGVGVARDEDKKKKRKPQRAKDMPPAQQKDLERKKEVLEQFEERAHDDKAELDEERTTRRSGRSEKARHRDRSKDVDLHHGFPKFIGGNRVQTYIKLTKELHYLYHEELYLLLEKELKALGKLPKGAGRASRKHYGRMVRSLSPQQQKALQAKIIEHAKKFDDRYRKTEYPDKRQKLEAAVRRGIREADKESAEKAKAKTKTKAKAKAKAKPGATAGRGKPAPRGKSAARPGAATSSKKPAKSAAKPMPRTGAAKAGAPARPAAKPVAKRPAKGAAKGTGKGRAKAPAKSTGKAAAAPMPSVQTAKRAPPAPARAAPSVPPKAAPPAPAKATPPAPAKATPPPPAKATPPAPAKAAPPPPAKAAPPAPAKTTPPPPAKATPPAPAKAAPPAAIKPAVPAPTKPAPAAKPPATTAGTLVADKSVPSGPPPSAGAAKMQAAAGGLQLAGQGLAALGNYVQGKAAEEAYQRMLPAIQAMQNNTDEGVWVHFMYTAQDPHPDSAINPVPMFSHIELQEGSQFGKRTPASLVPGGSRSQVQSKWLPPGQRSLKTELNNLWAAQKLMQGWCEREVKRTFVGRFLLERKGDSIDIAPIYDARAHLVSARIALEQKRPAAAEASMKAAEALHDEMFARIKAYTGKESF